MIALRPPSSKETTDQEQQELREFADKISSGYHAVAGIETARHLNAALELAGIPIRVEASDLLEEGFVYAIPGPDCEDVLVVGTIYLKRNK